MDGDLKLLDLIPKETSWMVEDEGKGGAFVGVVEERKLELRLGPPGEEWPAMKEKRDHHHSVHPALSLGYFSESKLEGFLQAKAGVVVKVEELSHKTKGRAEQQQYCCLDNAAGPSNGSQTRIASTSVVGWPPIRSFRKNLASTSKPSLESQKVGSEAAPKIGQGKGLFVKINMDGIPIGRKVDLKAYNSYEKLSLAVDDLFRSLREAQRDHHHAAGNRRNADAKQAITGLLDGTGEYTLVYEDDEGDRMLVGDVPWDMFVSTVKRLRVLKSSELSALRLGAVSRKRTATDC